MTAHDAITDHDITHAMIFYGGEFVSALGVLWRRADARNRVRLQDAFQELWQQYGELVALKRRTAAKAEVTP